MTAGPASLAISEPFHLAHGSYVRHHSSHYAMGTMFSITAYGTSFDNLNQIMQEAFSEVDRLDAKLSRYRPDSELSAINREASKGALTVSSDMFELLEYSLRLSEETSGFFDITVGPLMRSWGFFQETERVPSRVELLDLLKRTGYSHVTLNPVTRTIKFAEAGVELDLGAIGKGYAVDCVIQILRENGVDSALVSSGSSSLYALGAPPSENAWEISIRHPLDRRKQVCLLRLCNLAVAVSGTSERSFAQNGRLYGHILNPVDGEPPEDMLMTISVTPSSAESDALSTAFFAGGLDLGEAHLGCHPQAAAIFFVRDDSSQSFEEVIVHSSQDPLREERFAYSSDVKIAKK